MGHFIDLTGLKFSRLTVVSREPTANRRTLWLCLCICGKHVIVDGGSLRSKNTQSCGCLHAEVAALNGKSGFKHGDGRSPEYSAWRGMMRRCYSKKYFAYHRYGGRGITVCKRWEDYHKFLEDMNRKPSKEYSIDRYPNQNGNYEPGNCRWATKKQQVDNSTRVRLLEHLGVILSITDWAKKLKINRRSLNNKILKGLSIAEVIQQLKTPNT